MLRTHWGGMGILPMGIQHFTGWKPVPPFDRLLGVEGNGCGDDGRSFGPQDVWSKVHGLASRL